VQTHAIRWHRLANIGLATWFVTLSLARLSVIWPDRAIDMRLYLRGTSEWLSGGDPWTIHFGTMYFSAAPPSLVPMVPFALMPEAVAVALLTVLAVVASFWTLRKLGLPLWWIAWPPLVDNLWNLNPQIFLVPLLLGSAAWLAPIVKAYAVVPLIINATGMWVVGLGGGVLLGLTDVMALPAFGIHAPLGVRGFWISAIAGMALATLGIVIYFLVISAHTTRAKRQPVTVAQP